MRNSTKLTVLLENEMATAKLAKQLAQFSQGLFAQGQASLMVSLQGDLGAGKSYFARQFIQYFLPTQKVKSPTYTLVETYPLKFATVQHFDLYRLTDSEELEYLGIRDLLLPPVIGLVEWAEKGEGYLPPFDLVLSFEITSTLVAPEAAPARLATLSWQAQAHADSFQLMLSV